MKRDLAMKWCEALESGKYQQAIGALRNSVNSFCCLGVACDLVAPRDWETIDDDGKPYMTSDSYYPPEPIQDTYGFFTKRVAFNIVPDDLLEKHGTDRHKSLAEVNDNGWTFKQIAAFVRDAYLYI